MCKTIGFKKVCSLYGKSVNFVRTNLCRPEFNKYRLANNEFKECYGLIKEFENVLAMKRLLKYSLLGKYSIN